MRILFVTPYVPSLVRVRPYNFIKQLSRRNEVTLISLFHNETAEDEAIEQVRGYCEKIYMIQLSKTQAMVSCCRRLLSSVPLQAAYTEHGFACDLVKQVLADQEFDVLHVEHIRGAHLTSGVLGIPMIYDSVDCITRLLKQRLAKEHGIFRRALGAEELWKMRSYEARVAAGFEKVLITSGRDKRILEWLIRKYAGDILKASKADMRKIRTLMESFQDRRLEAVKDKAEHISVLRNGVDQDYFSPVSTPVEQPNIVFTGKMSYFPNIEAVQKFCAEVFPLIKRKVPDAHFTIAGSDPPESIRRLANESVTVTGYVPDIRPQIASASAVVCPMTIGVGIQNKVLEAMSMGKPVVASSIACSGIPNAVEGKHLLRADNPKRMSELVVELLMSPEKGRILGQNAARLVRDEYSWSAVSNLLEGIYGEAVYAHNNALSKAA